VSEATGTEPSDEELQSILEVMRQDRGSTIVTGIEASRDLAKMVFVMRWRLPEHGKAHAGAMQR